MECCTSTMERLPLSSGNRSTTEAWLLPQVTLLLCRVQWILKPYPTDEGSIAVDCHSQDWAGAGKAVFWLAAAIGCSLLIAGLSG